MILLSIERSRLKNAIIRVWRLTIEYHTIEQSDIESGNKAYLLDSIESDWNKQVNKKLVANGWEEVAITSVISEEIITNVAFQTFNNVKKVKEKYG